MLYDHPRRRSPTACSFKLFTLSFYHTYYASPIKWLSSHKFPSLEGLNVRWAELKPLAVLSLALKPFMPVGLNANGVVRANGMRDVRFLGELDLELTLSRAGVIALANLIKFSALANCLYS